MTLPCDVACSQMTIPYSNPSFTADATATTWRAPGLPRPTLAHFRGRVMNRVRSVLVRGYGGIGGHVIEAAHPSTAARCNLNKCSAKAKAKAGFPTQREHVSEMRRALFCIVPVGDSPPSSRLYLAIAAGCIPVIISDHFEGAFAQAVPWPSFSLRIAESTFLAGARSSSRKKRRQVDPPPLPLEAAFNLTAHLAAVAADAPRMLAMQTALQKHAADVLWEAPGSRVGHHALALATSAIRHVCVERPLPPGKGLPATAEPTTPTPHVTPGPQVVFSALT